MAIWRTGGIYYNDFSKQLPKTGNPTLWIIEMIEIKKIKTFPLFYTLFWKLFYHQGQVGERKNFILFMNIFFFFKFDKLFCTTSNQHLTIFVGSREQENKYIHLRKSDSWLSKWQNETQMLIYTKFYMNKFRHAHYQFFISYRQPISSFSTTNPSELR